MRFAGEEIEQRPSEKRLDPMVALLENSVDDRLAEQAPSHSKPLATLTGKDEGYFCGTSTFDARTGASADHVSQSADELGGRSSCSRESMLRSM
jgi:hypothetical protein